MDWVANGGVKRAQLRNKFLCFGWRDGGEVRGRRPIGHVKSRRVNEEKRIEIIAFPSTQKRGSLHIDRESVVARG